MQITPKADHYELKIRFSASKTPVSLTGIRKETRKLLEAILASLGESQRGGGAGFWRGGRVEELLVERRDLRG